MAALTAIAVGALVVAGASAYSSYRASKEAAKAQAEASAVSSASSKAAAATARRDAIRKSRVARAQSEQAAANTGTSGSSGEAGAAAGIQGQVSGMFSQISFNTKVGESLTKYQQQEADAMNKAQTASTIGQFSQSMFNSAGGFNSIFK